MINFPVCNKKVQICDKDPASNFEKYPRITQERSQMKKKSLIKSADKVFRLISSTKNKKYASLSSLIFRPSC